MLVWVHTHYAHYGVMLVIYFFVNLTQNEVIWEEETSVEKNTSNRLAYRQVCRTFS